MDFSRYRRELKIYHSAKEKNRLEKYLGAEETIPTIEIEARAGDLFSRSSIIELEKSLENTTEMTETETQARRNLLDKARAKFLENHAWEIGFELNFCRNAVRADFCGEKLTATESFARIRQETNSDVRREIYARFAEAQNKCVDLLLEKFRILQAGAETLGFENRRRLFEEISEIDFEKLARRGEKFLAENEAGYFQMLSEIFPGEKKLHLADYHFRRRQFENDKVFAGQNASGFFGKLLENFGFQAEKISNLKFLEVSAGKKSEFFRLNFPLNEVLFAAPGRGEISSEFFQTFGKTMQTVWTSSDLGERYPEFVFSPDAILAKAYGFLFRTLPTEENFLRRNFGLWDEKLARKFALESRFEMLFEIRRNIVNLLFETDFSASQSVDSAREFNEVFARDLGFVQTDILFSISADFEPAQNLRAMLFAAGLREYLRARYDFDWWNSRAAFEELIDFWNTAERYKAEDMVRMIGFEMNFDLLAEI